jgi:DNA-binding transcriptional ArsR family regulator
MAMSRKDAKTAKKDNGRKRFVAGSDSVNVATKKRVTINHIERELFADAFTYAHRAGMYLLTAHIAPVRFIRELQAIGVKFTKKDLIILTAIAFLTTEGEMCTRPLLNDLLPMDEMSIGYHIKRLSETGYITERVKGKYFTLCLSIEGHNVLMDYFNYSFKFQQRLLSQDV